MGDIPIQIPAQNFEIIRDVTGAILTLELADQTETSDVGVYLEKSTPFDQSDLPAVNISFDSVPYDEHDIEYRRGKNKYFIDVSVNAKSKVNEQADEASSLKCQRIAGIIAYILSAPQFVTLAFNSGLIQHRLITNMQMGVLSNQDSKHTVVCRITFEVMAGEEVGQIQGVTSSGVLTQVKIAETEKGFKYEIVTP